MKKNFRRMATLSIGISMLAISIIPLVRVWADAPENWQSQYVKIIMRQSDSATVGQSGDVTVTYKNNDEISGVVTVSGASGAIIDNITNYDYGNRTGNAAVIYTTATNGIILTAAPSQDYEASYMGVDHTEDESFNGTAELDALSTGQEYQPEFYFMPTGGQPDSEPQGNTEAVVTMHGRTITGDNNHYTREVLNNKGEVIESRSFYYNDTYIEASFSINGSHDYQYHHFQPNEVVAVGDENHSTTTYRYDYNEEEDHGKVDISLATLWNWRLVNDYVTINGIDYPITINYDDQKSYLDHYTEQIVSFTIEDVAKADMYDIKLDAMQKPDDAHTWIGNFLWTADPSQMYERVCDDPKCEILLDDDGNPVPGRDYIGNSELALIAVEYTVGNDNVGYTTYSCSSETGICSWWVSDAGGEISEGEEASSCNVSDKDCTIPYLEFDSNDTDGYDDGSLVVPSGARVTMQVIPNYGYQVMNVNMADLVTTDEGYGQFTFTVPEGAAYFVAEVIPVEDAVKTNTNIVAGGLINLGENQTTLKHGSARLEVEDLELSKDDIAAFEEAADGYEIKNYLNISLYNMTCKGGATCTGTDEDSWNTRIRDLNEAATITLQLEDGVDGNEIVIVHEKHDGTYEIIPVVYNPIANTITFETSSFSNYAIASRTVASPETGNFTIEEGASANLDDTGTIASIVAIAGIVLAGGIIAIIAKQHKM